MDINSLPHAIRAESVLLGVPVPRCVLFSQISVPSVARIPSQV